MNGKIKTRAGVGDIMCGDGRLTSNDKEKAEVLNKFFSSIFTVEDKQKIPESIPSKEFSEELRDAIFNENDVFKNLIHKFHKPNILRIQLGTQNGLNTDAAKYSDHFEFTMYIKAE